MTISDGYREQQQELHKNPNYGVASVAFAPAVAGLVKTNGFKSISDYGAGKCNLHKKLKEIGCPTILYQPYDPSFPEYGEPKEADLVCCIDVLEHVEPEFLTEVLDELQRITRNAGFFTVHTGPAGKVLPDGRNAHLIQESASWWLPQLCERFEIARLERVKGGFILAVEALGLHTK